MTRLTSLAKLRVPVGGQEIELQQVEFEAAGAPSTAGQDTAGQDAVVGNNAEPSPPASVPMNLLRTRIREKSRFTVFDIDPITAQQWGEALLAWARAQPRG